MKAWVPSRCSASTFSFRRWSRVLRQVPITCTVCRMPTARATSTAPTAIEKTTRVTALNSNCVDGPVWTVMVPGLSSLK
jgi:hypothetical protein